MNKKLKIGSHLMKLCMYESSGLTFSWIMRYIVSRGALSSRNVNPLPSAFLGQQSASPMCRSCKAQQSSSCVRPGLPWERGLKLKCAARVICKLSYTVHCWQWPWSYKSRFWVHFLLTVAYHHDHQSSILFIIHDERTNNYIAWQCGPLMRTASRGRGLI